MRRYPVGFLSLCASVACERFGFYLLLSLLFLYLNERVGFSVSSAADLIGVFVAASYVSPLLGGFVGDRWLGATRTATVGYFVAAGGYVLLGSEKIFALYAALALIAIGSGAAKPSVQALTARLYADAPEHQDGGFTLMYLFVNVSAVMSPIVGEAARTWFGWRAAFAVAALGLLVASGILRVQAATLRAAEQKQRNITEARPDAVKRSIRPLLMLCVIAVLFTIANMQASSTLLLWARDHTDRNLFGLDVPVPYIAALHAGLVIAVSPVLSFVFSRRRKVPEVATLATKISIGMAATGLAYVPMVLGTHISHGKELASLGWLASCLLLLSTGELLVGALGPSLVLGFAPARSRGRWIGVWYIATAVGYWMAGQLGALWTQIPHSAFFFGLAVLPMIGVALGLGCRRLAVSVPHSTLP